MDYLHPLLDDAAIARMSSLALAHVGDAVYEILVRTHLACGGTQTAKNLHSQTIALVRASAQAKAIEHILPDLTEEEQTVYRHGRNAKPKTVPKSATVAEYAHATALEAPDHPRHNFWFDEDGHIRVKNPSAFWLPEFTLQKEIGGTIYSITGTYDGTETLDKKMERIMAEKFTEKLEDSE